MPMPALFPYLQSPVVLAPTGYAVPLAPAAVSPYIPSPAQSPPPAPVPAAVAATLVATNTLLGWTQGAAGVSNNLYLGTSSNAVATATTASPQYQGSFAANSVLPVAASRSRSARMAAVSVSWLCSNRSKAAVKVSSAS